MLKFFVAKNTIAVASHIALEEAALPVSLEWVDFSTSQQRSDDFLAINPKGRVPALATEHGILTETPAILRYIATLAPQLLPTSPWAQAKADEWMSYLASTMHVSHAHKMRGHRWTPDKAAQAAMTAHVPQTMAENCAHVESQLPASGWALGDFSIVDAHLYAICRWLEWDEVDVSAFPRLQAHRTARRARPTVQKVEALHG